MKKKKNDNRQAYITTMDCLEKALSLTKLLENGDYQSCCQADFLNYLWIIQDLMITARNAHENVEIIQPKWDVVEAIAFAD